MPAERRAAGVEMQDFRLLHRLVCGLIRDASGKTGGRRDAKPPLVSRLVRGLICQLDHRNQSVSTK